MGVLRYRGATMPRMALQHKSILYDAENQVYYLKHQLHTDTFVEEFTMMCQH